MQLVNSQYKVKGRLIGDTQDNTLVTEDLYNGTMKNLRILSDSKETRDFIEYMKRNLPEYRNLIHPNICRTFFFNKIVSIDNKPVSTAKYYQAYQAINGEDISVFARNASFEEKVDVFYQLLSAIKFLHLRGFLLCNINPRELFVEEVNLENGRKHRLLISSLPYLEHCARNERMEKDNLRFIPPESFQFGNYTRLSDIYLIGEICFYLYFGDYKSNNLFADDFIAFEKHNADMENHGLTESESFIFRIIKKCVSPKMMDRYHTAQEIHLELNTGLKKDIPVCDKNLLQKLPENITSQVGRETLICDIIKDVYGRLFAESSKMVVLVKGEKGTGKSALLKTLGFRFSQEGFNVSYENASPNADEDFYTIKSVIRNIRKYSSAKIMEKYNIAVNEILSELTEKKQQNAEVQSLHSENIHKTAQFIQEISEVIPLVICIDNIENIDEKSLAILYHLTNLGKGKIFIVLAEGVPSGARKKSVEDFLESIKERDMTEEYNIGNLTIEDTGEYIRLLLGMDRIPQELAASVYTVTSGNPEAVYELINKLVSEEIVSLNESCEWDIKKLESRDLDFSSESKDNLMDRFNRLSSFEKDMLERLSVFNIPVTVVMIFKYFIESRDNVFNSLKKLEISGLLVQKEDDRGNVFSFTNNNFRIRVYESLGTNRKKELHKLASEVLEEMFVVDEKIVEDEIVYHKINAGEEQQVVEYLINIGNTAMDNYDANSAITHYSQAVELLMKANEKKLYVQLIFKLGLIYEGISEFEKALDMFEEAARVAIILQDFETLINIDFCEIEIHMNMGLKREAKDHLISAKNILRRNLSKGKVLEVLLYTADILSAYKRITKAEQVIDKLLQDKDIEDYPGLFGRGKIQKGRILIDKGDLSLAVEEMIIEGRALLEKSGEWKHLIKGLNILGIYYDSSGLDDKAINCYEEALYIGNKTNNLEYHVRLYNNMAEVYRKEDKNKEAIALYSRAINLKGSEYYAMVRGVNYYNLAITYTDMEYFSESIQYRVVYENFLKAGQAMEYLEEFHLVHLSQFYYQLGHYEKAIHFAEEAEVLCIKWGIASDLEAKMYITLSEAYMNKKRDYSKEMALLQAALERKNYKTFRLVCIRLAIMSINEKKLEKGKEMYELGMQYHDEIDTEMLGFYYDLVVSYFYSGEEKLNFLIELSERAGKIDGFDLKRLLFTAIGDAHCELGDFRNGMYFYAVALNYIRKGISHVPVAYRDTYLSSHSRVIVKQNILEAAKKLYEKEMISKNILSVIEKTQVYKKNSPEKYFDFEVLRKICIGDEIGANSKSEIMTGPLEDLIGRITEGLTGNPEKNLDWYIEKLTKYCHGTRGFIIDFHGEGSQELITSYNGYTKKEYYNNIIEKVLQTQDVYFIPDVFGFKGEEYSDMFGEEISSIVCIPIIQESTGANDWVFEKRKKSTGKNNILGFIFIESESVINNITIETINLCRKTLQVCHLLMDNLFLHEMVSIDRLTLLYTRKHFEASLTIEIEKIIRLGGEFSLIMCDIDKFKSVNDSFGHQMGDEILRKVAALIMGSVRKEDICARYGGEEMVILLPGASSEIAMGIAEKIRISIDAAKLLGGQRPLTISMGVANSPDHSTWASDLIEKADQALYFAKENGRNRSVLFSQMLTTEPKRIDKLAGIVSGELINDQRSVETILEIIQLSRSQELSRSEKLFQFLGRVIEAAEADFGIIIKMDSQGEIKKSLFRKKMESTRSEDLYYSNEILRRCIENSRGEYVIDWGNYPGMDKTTGMPDWQSVLVTQIISSKTERIMLYLSVSLRNKEFNGDVYNFVKTLCEMVSVI